MRTDTKMSKFIHAGLYIALKCPNLVMQDYISIAHNRTELEKKTFKNSVFYVQFVLISKFDIYIPQKVKKKWLYYKLIAEISKPHSVIQ